MLWALLYTMPGEITLETGEKTKIPSTCSRKKYPEGMLLTLQPSPQKKNLGAETIRRQRKEELVPPGGALTDQSKLAFFLEVSVTDKISLAFLFARVSDFRESSGLNRPGSSDTGKTH